MSCHYYFFEKLKIVEKNLSKLNCSICEVSHALKVNNLNPIYKLSNKFENKNPNSFKLMKGLDGLHGGNQLKNYTDLNKDIGVVDTEMYR